MTPFAMATENLKRAYDEAVKAAAEVVETDFIGSEHFVYAFLQIPECEAYRILTQAGVDGDEYARDFIRATKGAKGGKGLTPATQAICERAALAARSEGLPPSTAHVLSEILANESSYACKYLRRMAGESAAEQRSFLDTLHVKTQLAIQILKDKKEMGEDVTTLTGGQSSGANSIVKRYEQRQAAPSPYAPAQAVRNYRPARRASKLPDCGLDMTERARRGKMDPVIGRKKELEKLVQVLSRRLKNNPVLIGEPGVGKSAIVEGLCQLIVSGNVPEQLLNKTVFSVDLAGMLAGTKYRGDFEEKLKNLIEVVQQDGDVILFIDEIHTLVGAGGSAESNMDAANLLKPLLARGDLQLIGATTIEEYRKYIEKDAALERRFTPVQVDEPSQQDAIAILKGVRGKYEEHHGIVITDEAV